jgi:homoserine kinase type II
MQLQPDQKNDRFTEAVRRLVEENYDLGKLTHVKEITGGYCNKSYAVWVSAHDRILRYFLRLYNPNAIENEVLFEHALLNHLRSKGFTLAAAIVSCRNGATVVRTPPPENHRGEKALWAMFEFLEGEDKYSWTCTDLTDKEFAGAAQVLAHLHHCGHGFQKPPGVDRVQPRIMEFIPTLGKAFSALLDRAGDRRCDRLFRKNFEPICKALDDAASLDAGLQGMREIPIHCDYHPGNLKYRDEKCVGIFDFDWSKIDYRLFDVALGLVYFTSIWDERAAGLRPDKFTLFLDSYNEACSRFTHIEPLTRQEQRYLVPMLSIANLYVLNWDLSDFYHYSDPDDDEYYMYMNHNIGLMHWLTFHEDELQGVVEFQGRS